MSINNKFKIGQQVFLKKDIEKGIFKPHVVYVIYADILSKDHSQDSIKYQLDSTIVDCHRHSEDELEELLPRNYNEILNAVNDILFNSKVQSTKNAQAKISGTYQH
jgi:hypothetical protein